MVGVVATAATVAIAAGLGGRVAATAALAAGGVAIGMTLLARRLVRRSGQDSTVDRLHVYGIGVVLRMLGVLVVGVLVAKDRTTFPPLPTAFGYLGVILPLLYLETQRTR